MRQGGVKGAQPFEIVDNERGKGAAHANAKINESNIEMRSVQKDAVQKPKSTNSELMRKAKASGGGKNNSVRDTFLGGDGTVKLLSDSNTVSLDKATVELAGVSQLKVDPGVSVI